MDSATGPSEGPVVWKGSPVSFKYAATAAMSHNGSSLKPLPISRFPRFVRADTDGKRCHLPSVLLRYQGFLFLLVLESNERNQEDPDRNL